MAVGGPTRSAARAPLPRRQQHLEGSLARTLIALKRACLLAFVWAALTGADAGALWPGVIAVAGGTWLSLALMPPRGRGIRLAALAAMTPGFLWRSVVGGADVAWRALHPRMPLSPGWLVVPTALPSPGARVALGGKLSLLPGTLVAGTRNGTLLVHCLDTRQDIATAIADEEATIGAVAGTPGWPPEAGR
ncbi:MAG: Na+/H+ antiporter subunit E [Alphaproteobacteria bacterium]